jgi:hypothetical protein
MWCLPPILIDSLQDIAAAGVNPTAHPTPPASYVSSRGADSVILLGTDFSLPKRPFLEARVIGSMMV